MWDEIAEAYDRALQMPPAERASWLAAHTSPPVRREVEAMLCANEPLELESELLADDTFADGSRIGNYVIRRRLGQGGMGEVYLAARDGVDFEQLVAIKVLRVAFGGRDAAGRFRRERRILAHLNHPAVVPLLDSGVAPDGRPYLVLQYVEGEPITRYCESHQLSLDARLRLFVDVCRAVQYAHGRLIIHRDLKPSNILVTPDGEPRLLDFGIAKALAPEEPQTELTHREAAPMTPERAAPEQLRGEVPSTATDVWALGVLLYELAAGKLPFAVTGRSRAEIERAVTGDFEPLRLRSRGDLDTVISVALRREPEQRYASAGQLADDVERVLAGEPVFARPHSIGYRLRRFVGRNRAATAAIALAILSLIAFSAATAMQSGEVARQRDRAEAEQAKANAVVETLVEILGGAEPAVAGGRTVDVDQLLARGEKRASELKDQPAVQAGLWYALGKIHGERSNHKRARDLLALAHTTQVRLAGPADPQSLEMEIALATVEATLGRGPSAEKRLRGVLARLEEGRALDPKLKLTAMTRLATIVRGQEGMRLAERALELRRRAEPPDPVAIAGSLNVLGVLAWNNSSREAAERYWQEGVTVLSRAVPEDDANLLVLKGNLAAASTDPAQQIALYRSLIAAHEKRFGPESGQVANSWNNLATALANQGDFESSLQAYQKAVAKWSRIFGRDHPETLNARRSVAVLLLLTQQFPEALRQLEAVEAALHNHGGQPEFVANVRTEKGHALIRLGRFAEAERMVRMALADLTRLQPEHGRYRLQAQHALAWVFFETGRYAEAEAELRQGLRLKMKTLPPNDRETIGTQVLLGRTLLALGRHEEARELLEETVEPFARHPFTAAVDADEARRDLQQARMSGSRSSEAPSG